MRRTYIDVIGEYYNRRDEDELMKGGQENFKNEEGTMSRKLLIIDDEAQIRSTYLRIFTRRGFDVFTAPSAMDAQDLLVRQKMDIVFLDINMAEVEGDVLFELLRAFHKNIKVIVTSVYPIEEQKERIKDADAYFDKSDGQEVLVHLVSSMLN